MRLEALLLLLALSHGYCTTEGKATDDDLGSLLQVQSNVQGKGHADASTKSLEGPSLAVRQQSLEQAGVSRAERWIDKKEIITRITEIVDGRIKQYFGSVDSKKLVTVGQAQAVLFTILGGVSMGCYPALVKARPVLQANVHPFIFQCYKFCFFPFLDPDALKGHRFQFSWWGVASAAVWVPSGVCYIASVQILGAGFTPIIVMATQTIFAFVFSVTFLGEKVTTYETLVGGTYSLAPEMVVGIIVGVVGLAILLVSQSVRDYVPIEKDPSEKASPSGMMPSPRSLPARSENGDILVDLEDLQPTFFSYGVMMMIGFVLAFVAGACAAAHNLIMLIGRRSIMISNGCMPSIGSCPADVQEEFDIFGSWAVSFGLGSGMMTIVYLAIHIAIQNDDRIPRNLYCYTDAAGLCDAFFTFSIAQVLRLSGRSASAHG
eukprot:CAMPEP_0169208824 /NCGR_PEP_ID=MMETSP1016-20121227/14341_1 /TAXON_ID=342587 /ORGANISM="Karlodinium micrum, Strain CCMP2283" /LENGTH=432 /DNA_ID=CAMNT_0009286231 /DNA_START=90 /DNA_END=1390 /DNA_ORIENTATION=+